MLKKKRYTDSFYAVRDTQGELIVSRVVQDLPRLDRAHLTKSLVGEASVQSGIEMDALFVSVDSDWNRYNTEYT